MDILKIIDQYNSEGRFYHNFLHVAKMFQYAKVNHLKLTEVQKMAILFHDVVYVPGSEHNEEDSCEWVLKNSGPNDWIACKEEGLPNTDVINTINLVCKIILDTKSHLPRSGDLSRDVIDLDLYELALQDLYGKNSTLILAEFSDLPYKKFMEGRINWIETFLNRESIYVGFLKNKFICDIGDFTYEESARKNLQNELNFLKNRKIGI